MIRIIKCRVQDSKENGLVLEDIYKKCVEIIKCKIKENLLNGISIAQILDSEDEMNIKI